MIKKEIKKYFFSVEGETEKWYLDWLEKKINSIDSLDYKVKLESKVEKNPMKRAKQLTAVSKPKIVHIVDFEEENNESNFKDILSYMKEAQEKKRVKYILGYSNYTFELWIILHKQKFNRSVVHRSHYLSYINRLFDAEFESLAKYKEKNNFDKVLEKLSINDVKYAIKNAEEIMNDKREQGYIEQSFKTYKYYRENPSLSIHEHIKKIFIEVGLI